MAIDTNQLAKEILRNNQYMVIGSRDNMGNPWVSPVVYAPDKENNLYFISLPSSRHGQNIANNPKAVVSIYDSHQPWGEGVGLQIEGEIEALPLTQIPSAITLYLTRKWPFANNKLKAYLEGFQKVLKNRTYKIYRFSPHRIWINDPNADTDVRVEVNLS